MSTAAQITANQANSKLSTGPQTEVGKTASSKNSFRHGLSGTFIVQGWENGDHYDELLDGLRQEHQPATPTEALLVERMAQHWWLAQRALHLQELTFNPQVHICDDDKQLALYLRYQTTHERAFSKCLNDLTKLRVEQLKAAERLERVALAARAQEASQERREAVEARAAELHAARVQALNARTKLTEAKAAVVAKPATVHSRGAASDTALHNVLETLAAQDAHLQDILSQNKAA